MHIIHTDDVLGQFPDCVLHFVSSKGIGRDVFSKRLHAAFPEYFKSYKRLVLRGGLEVGQTIVFPLNTLFGTTFISVFVIKNSWQEKTKPENIKACLSAFKNVLLEYQPRSIATCVLPDAPAGWLEKHLVTLTATQPDCKLIVMSN